MSNEKKDLNPEDNISLEEKIELLSKKIDHIGMAEYVRMISNPKRLLLTNFFLGMVRGVGMGIGFTLLTGLLVATLIYVLSGWVNMPFIGRIIADLIDIIENYRI